MKKIEDVRRENLQRLRKELGSVKALAERLGKEPPQVSQWLNASVHSVSGKPRTISSESCREVERALGKPEGWMDVEHVAATLTETTDLVQLRKVLSEASSEVRLLSVYRLADAGQREVIDAAVRLVIDQLDITTLLCGRR
jgi:DNA-binding transcriptional regulator YdaS (Cro superfamily)